MKTITPASLFAPLAPAEWEPSTQATLYGPDLDDPWRSVYGFPLAAVQLAAGQKLRLFCREDEIFELLGKLNALLACPTVLNRAYKSGRQLEQAVQCKIERLLERQKLLRANGRQVGQSEPVTSLEAAGDSSLSRLITRLSRLRNCRAQANAAPACGVATRAGRRQRSRVLFNRS